MKEYFELNRKEKRQEWLLLSACILLFLIIIKGVYNQEHNIDQDNILIPLFFLFGGIFFLDSFPSFSNSHVSDKTAHFTN